MSFKEDGMYSSYNKVFCYLKIMIVKKRQKFHRIKSLILNGKKNNLNKK